MGTHGVTLRAHVAADLITVIGVTVSPAAACPCCRALSRRVHSRYLRTLADLPWEGVAVRARLRARRFVCEEADCPRSIFTERLPAVAAPYARQTARLGATLRLIGAALGGASGERLAAAPGMHTAGSTLLAHLRGAPAPGPPVPRVLGVDDLAWRGGRRYGTVLVDLERHRVVDVLPDRTGATFTAWLQAHPGVQIISRGRGGPYADAARVGALTAVQVADRFHLVADLRAALEALLVRHAEDLRAAARHRETTRDAAAERRRDAGVTHVGLCARLNLGRGTVRTTVRTWLRAGQFPERATPSRGRKVPTKLAPYLQHVADRVAARSTDVVTQLGGLRARGCTGAGHTVRRMVARLTHRNSPRRDRRARRVRGPARSGRRRAA